jgi:aryl-alcohol dehydrogenase-like predicted oxidoreductase
MLMGQFGFRSLPMTPISSRVLGSSDLAITPLGFGAWAIGGGDWAYAWGPQDDDASVDAIVAAVTDGGHNWIDTAPVYGLGPFGWV